ncbi:hypothetical protein DSM16313_26250 [Acinetobacter seohaensis]|nr:hypothetical protein DSM16313_26250 [Acinetobacter seohaensis]
MENKVPYRSERKPDWRQRLKPWFTVLSFLSLFWVGWILWEAWPQALSAMGHFDSRWLMLTLLGTTVGGYLVFEVFYLLFRQGVGAIHSKRELSHLFFVAQLMKHLPGRIWGVAYQASQTTQASIGQWLGVNLTFMLLTIFFAAWVSSVFLSYFLSASWFLGAIASGLIIYFVVWSNNSFRLFKRLLKPLTNKKTHQWLDALEPYAASDCSIKTKIFFIAAISWACYYLAWGIFGYAWPGLNFLGGLQLCALYTLAWFIGYLVFLFPSGAGVRELAFLYFAKDYPFEALAAMVIFGRLILLFTDIILGLSLIHI